MGPLAESISSSAICPSITVGRNRYFSSITPKTYDFWGNNVDDLIRHDEKENPSGNYSAVATGAHDVLFTRKYLKKYGIRTISDDEISAHMCSGGDQFHRSSNKLASQVLKSYGFANYYDIDIYDRADIVCDLSRPVSV